MYKSSSKEDNDCCVAFHRSESQNQFLASAVNLLQLRHWLGSHPVTSPRGWWEPSCLPLPMSCVIGKSVCCFEFDLYHSSKQMFNLVAE